MDKKKMENIQRRDKKKMEAEKRIGPTLTAYDDYDCCVKVEEQSSRFLLDNLAFLLSFD
jgi:hypothetical protein